VFLHKLVKIAAIGGDQKLAAYAQVPENCDFRKKICSSYYVSMQSSNHVECVSATTSQRYSVDIIKQSLYIV
jgi:hypothetical protein